MQCNRIRLLVHSFINKERKWKQQNESEGKKKCYSEEHSQHSKDRPLAITPSPASFFYAMLPTKERGGRIFQDNEQREKGKSTLEKCILMLTQS